MSTPSALTGIRIVDFSHVYQGPVGTQILADYGADVIKVERPEAGDWSRRWGPFVHGVSLPYAGLNRNKRSFALNLKSPQGITAIRALIATADVVVHNFRAGVMEKLGLGYEQLGRSRSLGQPRPRRSRPHGARGSRLVHPSRSREASVSRRHVS